MYGSAGLQAELALRNEFLRAPHGLVLTPSELALDEVDTHLGAFQQQNLVGCVVLKRVDEDVVRMRQVAVRVQGQGVGRMLSLYAEERARAFGASRIILDGRESAVGFYKRLGYVVESGPHSKNTGPHFYMSKNLNSV